MQGNITGEFWKLLEYLKVGESCHCHGEIMYEDTSWIEDDCPDTFFLNLFFYFLLPCSCSVSWFLIGWQCWNIKCRVKFSLKTLDWFGKCRAVVTTWGHQFFHSWILNCEVGDSILGAKSSSTYHTITFCPLLQTILFKCMMHFLGIGN